MYNEDKVWSIEIGEDLEVERHDEKRRESLAARPPAQDQPRIILRKKPARAAKAGKKAPFRLHFALLLPLTWLLGPLAILLTPEGRQRKDWALMGPVMTLTWVALFIQGDDLLVRAAGGPALYPLMFLYALALFAGFTVWARAVHLAGGSSRPADHKMPTALRQSWGTGLLGFLFPGMGLLAAGYPRRAAGVVWLGWIPVAGLALLGAAPLLMRMATTSGPVVVSRDILEKSVMLSAALVALGLIGWLVQALDGARLAPGENLRIGARRGDLFGLALLAAVMALFAVADPGPVARQLGRQAQGLRAEGYRLVPLTMVRTAAFLDPGRTDYTVIAMEIYEEMGQEDRSRELRQDLDRNLASYRDLVWGDETERNRAPRTEPDPSAAAMATPAMGAWTFGSSAPWLVVAPPGWGVQDGQEEKKDPEPGDSGSPSQR